jgi:hypothetical protein
VGHRNGDAARLLLGGVVDGLEGPVLHLGVLLGQHLGDGAGQHGLAVVDVPDGADVQVRLGPLEFLFRHSSLLPPYVPVVMMA